MATSVPSTCKALVAEKAGAELVYKDVPLSKPEKGQILVKVLACGVCHTDDIIRKGSFGDLFPRILGHEIVGDVVAVGPGETKWKVPSADDDIVVCKQCNRGQFQMCANAAVNGMSMDGGYAEYCILRSEAVVTIDRDADPAAIAPLLCAGVTIFQGIRQMGIPQGDTVAIQGLGGLGHLGVQYARKMGYRTVALSSSGAKRDFAMKLGANDYFDASKEDHSEALQAIGGAALIVVTAPNPSIISGLLNGLAAGGKLLILSPVGDVQVNTVSMITKALSVHGWPSGHALNSEEAVQFASHHDVNCMIEKFPLADANKALKHMAEGSVRFRGVLIP